MPLKNLLSWRAAGVAAAAAVVLATAVFFRLPAFWTSHAGPVEMAYVTLAMKMGVHPGLTEYDLEDVKIRPLNVPEVGNAGGFVPALTPFKTTSGAARHPFTGWPSDSNPFYYKPPLFPSFLAYNHHRVFGAKFAFYPVLAPDPIKGHKAASAVQGWAVTVPFIGGLAVIALTLALGWRLFGPAAGLLAALLIAVHPFHILASSRIWPETTLTAFCLAAAVLFHRFVSTRNWPGCALAGIAYGLAVLTDPAALFILPAFWAWGRNAAAPASAVRKLFNPFFLAFLAGAVLIGKAWFDYTQIVFAESALKPAAAWSLPDSAAWRSFLSQSVRLFWLCPPLAAIIFSLKSFSGEKSVRAAWFFIVSFVAARWLFSPGSFWDERSMILIGPFAALLAAHGVLRVISRK